MLASRTKALTKRNQPIEDHLRSLDADILVLPEAWRFRDPSARWAEDLAQSMGYELHQWVAPTPSRPKDIAPWRMVILTRVPVVRLEDTVLPQFDKLGDRAVVRVQLKSGLRIAGLHLYGIHWLIHRSPRGFQAERKALRQIATENDIVAGDFNMWSPIVHRDLPGLRPTAIGRTFPAWRPHSQIDHVMVSERVDVVSTEVLPAMGSDHHPLRLEFRAS